MNDECKMTSDEFAASRSETPVSERVLSGDVPKPEFRNEEVVSSIPPSSFILHHSSFRIVLLAAALLSGCGRPGPALVPVEGTITFGGGPWPAAGIVYFTVESTGPGTSAHPTTGTFDTSGKLTVRTFNRNGVMPGTYHLKVECWKVPPIMGSPTPPVSYVPERYQSPATSGLVVTVEPGQRVVRVNLDVPKQ
jgi:hypothetical protein